jgi:Ca2+-binding RTX toxin-like protein
LDLAGVTATTGSTTTVNLTGAGAVIASSMAATTINTVTVSGTGALTVASADRAATAMTITAGTADDSIAMRHANDVLNGGLGTDTLVLTPNFVLGGVQIDLSSAADQITTFNGSANAAVQIGFENVDLSGITGSFGADITAIKTGSTITGTANSDVITGGAAADTVVMTAGNDAVTLGGGNDTFKASATRIEANDTGSAVLDGGTGTDILEITAATTIADADLRGITSIETLILADASNTVVLAANAQAAGLVTVISSTGVDKVSIGNAGVTYYTHAGADGTDEITVIATTTGLVYNDSNVATADDLLILSAWQDAAADWGAEQANLAAVNAADEWFFDNTTGVLHVWNENKAGGAGISTITFVGVNDITDGTAVGHLNIDVAA